MDVRLKLSASPPAARRPAPAPCPAAPRPTRRPLEPDRFVASAVAAEAQAHERVVRALYRELLGREPDAVGLADFTARLRQGASPAHVRAAIADSYEHRYRRTVLGLYRGLLGREPDAGGYATCMRALEAGAPLHEVRRIVLDSPEYQAGPPDGAISDEAFVTSLYHGLLGREPDAAGMRDHLARLRAGTPRQVIRDAVMGADEYRKTLPPPPPAPVAEAPAPSAPKPAAAPFISQLHPAGAENGYWNGRSNCGPATMAMIGRAFGHGDDLTDAGLITELMGPGGTSEAGTGVDGIAAMAKHMKLASTTRGPGAQVEWIAEQLRQGRLVAANGNYYAMRPHENAQAVAEGRGGHYVAVVGLDPAGDFLVHDPFHDNGGAPMAYTPAELARFIDANSNGGWQIAVGR